MRKLLVGLVLLTFVPSACGDSNSDGDDGSNEAGSGGSAGEDPTGGTSGASGTSPTGGKGGKGGASGSSSGGTAGDAGMGGEPSTGGTGMDDGGEAGMAGEPSTGGTAGAGMGGSGTAGGGNGGSGTAGGGKGGTGGAAVETNCSDGMDNDNDMATDCADSDCTLLCALGACPTGTSPVVYSATGLPLAIPDNAMDTAFVPISVSNVGVIAKIAAQVGIAHTYDGDLVLQLVSPTGTMKLAQRRGGTADNYAGTVFVDSAATAIAAGTAPFSGSFRPEQPLATLSGLSHNGTFGLRVADRLGGDSGQITSFSVAMCQCRGGAACEFGPVACENRIDDDGDGLIDCQETACASSPSCPATEHACGDGVDNDSNAATDCADPACAWACTGFGSTCTGTNRIFTYRTREVPQAISAVGTASYYAPIFAASRGTVVSTLVRFNATHGYDGDLNLTLTSPLGTSRIVSDDNGMAGDNYVNTVFIDSAATAITAGTAPFTGSYRPEEAFSGWTSQQAVGLWAGELADDADGDGGNFTELSLGLCVTP